MDGSQILFYSTKVRGGLEEMEKSFTNVRDKLDILKTQTEILMTDWEGPAGRQWAGETGRLFNQLEECLKGLNQLTGAVNEIAAGLIETERNNEILAT